MSHRPQRLLANVPLIYVIRMAALAYGLAVPTLVRFWQVHGLTLTQVTVLQAVFAVTMALGQGPTGMFADLFTRRASIAIGAALDVVGAGLYIHSTGFSGFLAAEIVTALGMSFVSGADRALLYESLCERGKGETFSAEWGRMTSASLAWVAATTLIGGFLATRNLVYPFYGVLLLMGLQLGAGLSLTEPTRRILEKPRGSALGRVFLDIIKFCWKDPTLRGLLACTAVLTALTQFGLWLYQPYFELCKLPLAWWGAAFCLYNLTAAAASLLADRLTAQHSLKTTSGMLVALLVSGYLLLGLFSPLAGFLFILLHQVVRGMLQATMGAAITRAAPDEVRATVSSIGLMALTLVYASFLPAVGWVADTQGLPPAFLGLAMLSLVAGAAVLQTLRTSDLEPASNPTIQIMDPGPR